MPAQAEANIREAERQLLAATTAAEAAKGELAAVQPKVPQLSEALEAARIANASASSANAKAVESRATATAQLKATNNASVVARQAVANADVQEEIATAEVKKCASQLLQLQTRLSELRAAAGDDEQKDGVFVLEGQVADAADALSAAKTRAAAAAKAAESAAEQESQATSQQEAASETLQLAEEEADRIGTTAEQCRAALQDAEAAYNAAHKRCALAEESKQAADDALSKAMTHHKDCVRKRDEARSRAAEAAAKISEVEERRERRLDSNRHGLKRTLQEMRAALQRKAYAARDTLIAELEGPAFVDDFEDDDDDNETEDSENSCPKDPVARAPGTTSE